MAFEYLQVFSDSCIPHHLRDELTDFYEVSNDTYKRWYPFKKVRIGIKQETVDLVNAALFAEGMEADPEDQYFHVLIHFSW